MKLYATSDIHGFNLERLDTLIDLKDETSILIDNGDFFIGSAYATYLNHRDGENHLVTLAKQAGFDVMIPGNHDFDYGLEFYQDIVRQLDVPVVSCNLFDNNDEHLFKPYVILHIENKKVGIIGATTSNLFQLSRFENVKNIRCQSAPVWIQHYVEQIRSEVDVLIVSYHGGIECDLKTGAPTQYNTKEDEAYAIAHGIEGIDVLICGHQHRQNEGLVDQTLVVQVPEHLRKISCIDIDTFANTWIVPQQESIMHSDFEAWLDQPVNLDELHDFITQRYPADYVHLDIKGQTHRDLKEAFNAIYQIKTYHYPQEELHQFSWINDKTKDCVIATNVELDAYRLQSTSIENIFDAYYHSLMK